VVRGDADRLLIRADKAANAAGARALGFGDPRPVLDALRRGELRGLVALGHDVLHPQHLGGIDALASLDALVVLDTHHSELERVAHAVLPARHAAEKHGTLVNHAGRVQRVRPAVEPPADVLAEGEILARLGALLALPGFDGKFDPGAVSRGLGDRFPAFAGIDLESVGDQGRPLVGRSG
jgi:predicted molibdopterin-dependent oxidoreductase YjgC